MKIGLVGEAPNDTSAIQNLLSQKYAHLEFVTLLNRINGSMLDNRKAIRRLLRIEYESQNPDLVLFIRDLDALEHDAKAKRKRQETFSYSNKIVDRRGLHLLNIYEIEALIVADIQVFNEIFRCQLAHFHDPMTVEQPKEILIEASNYQFNESHTPELFKLLNIEILRQNCRYFASFIIKFERRIV
jgi:hypothetical protein